jgi:hypothetical protein
MTIFQIWSRVVLDGKRTRHLHVLRSGSPEIDDYRLFRDALRHGGLLAVDNAISHAGQVAEFRALVSADSHVTEALAPYREPTTDARRRSVSRAAMARIPWGPTVSRNQATRAPGRPFHARMARP